MEAVRTVRRGDVIEERWVVYKSLGAGSFGDVWEVEDGEASSCDEADRPIPRPRYAIKIEPAASNTQILKMEVLVLKRLNAAKAKHACRLISRGRNETMNFLVMSLTGRSLSHLRKKRPLGHFSQETALRVTAQCLDALEEMHDVGFVHRDIKPGNFAVEHDPQRRLVLILDFGLARAILTSDGEPRKPRESTGFRGTVRFAPLSAHAGREMGRKDDLESAWYQHCDISTTGLPWADASSKAQIEARKKESRETRELFHGLPEHLTTALDYVDGLASADAPNYALLQSLLADALVQQGAAPDAHIDWDN